MASASSPQITITKQQAQVQFFEEDLGNGIVLRMMQIPGGTFTMGSPEDELERQGREGPQHEMTVPPFFMGKYPITQAQWRAVALLEPMERELEAEPSSFKGDDRPVETVSWEDATEFCQRLSRFTGRTYRLPSEAEWEYACRAGTTTPFHFGETITTELANYRGTDEEEYGWSGSYGDGPKGEYRQETTPVGYFEVTNTFGLSDTHGNVREWCQDHYHDSYEEAPADGTAWEDKNPRKDELRILRGGSWVSEPRNCRSAYRLNDGPADRNGTLGFRVVCVTPRA